jgi:hypothetical protein
VDPGGIDVVMAGQEAIVGVEREKLKVWHTHGHVETNHGSWVVCERW